MTETQITPLIDVITIRNSIHSLRSPMHVKTLELISLANFIENIVLFDRLYVEKEYYLPIIQEFSNKEIRSLFSDEINSMIVPISFTTLEKKSALEDTMSMLDSTDLSSLRLKITKKFSDVSLKYALHNYRYRTEHTSHNSYDDILMDKKIKEKVKNSTEHLFSDWDDFFESLGSAFRTWRYLTLAAQKGLSYVPNDFRSLFIEFAIENKITPKIQMGKLENLYDQKVDTFVRDDPNNLRLEQLAKNNPTSKILFEKLHQKSKKRKEKIANWFGEQYEEKISCPLIFNYIVNKAKDISDIIPLALDLRNSSAAKEFRENCHEIDIARKNNDMEYISKKIHQIDKILKNLIDNNSQNKSDITFSFPPSISFTTNYDAIKDKITTREFVLLRKIFNGLSNPRSIKEMRDFFHNQKQEDY